MLTFLSLIGLRREVGKGLVRDLRDIGLLVVFLLKLAHVVVEVLPRLQIHNVIHQAVLGNRQIVIYDMIPE